MKKTALASLLLVSFFSSTAFAAKPQIVNLCLNVVDNVSPYTFFARFVSSDVFDFGNQTGDVRNGQSCTSHEYQHGPKNLTFKVRGGDFEASKDVQFLPDESCTYLHKVAPGVFESAVQRSSASYQSRLITLIQAPPMSGYKYTYYMHCEYTAR